MKMYRGFTLIEVLLSVSAITILAGFSIPVVRTMFTKNDLDIATVTTAQTLRRAQNLSQTVTSDQNWGIKVQSGSITLFQGASYASRDSSFDEVFVLPASITPSGISETVFTKLSGDPQTTGTITLSTDNDSDSVIINSKGMVNY